MAEPSLQPSGYKDSPFCLPSVVKNFVEDVWSVFPLGTLILGTLSPTVSVWEWLGPFKGANGTLTTPWSPKNDLIFTYIWYSSHLKYPSPLRRSNNLYSIWIFLGNNHTVFLGSYIWSFFFKSWHITQVCFKPMVLLPQPPENAQILCYLFLCIWVVETRLVK